MNYQQAQPCRELSRIVKNYWSIDSEGDAVVRQEKIIPDGYPELIFHYGDSYRSKINRSWEQQAPCLIAGQIRKYFYLENTGVSRMFAIKLQPWALKLCFDVDVHALTDRVVALNAAQLTYFDFVRDVATSEKTFGDKVPLIEEWFLKHLDIDQIDVSKGETAVALIINRKGAITITEVIDQIGISERSLERYFKKYIGLSPKFYSRIIRFSNIFEFVQQDNFSWADVLYPAGYYDQAHFIKNFKEFTGEEPSKYGFDEVNMANFFLKK